jgi:hypothetical protein
MRKQATAPPAGLLTQNLSRLKALLKEPIGNTSLRFLFAVIASALDANATGAGDWVSIGKNLNGTSFLLTYHYAGGKAYCSGTSLEELATDCSNLLEPSEMV